jgi:predicted ABC-type ATPase
VRKGGHNIPEEVIRRRYNAGLSNFFRLYMNEVDEWVFFDNSAVGQPRAVATGGLSNEYRVLDGELWNKLSKTDYE